MYGNNGASIRKSITLKTKLISILCAFIALMLLSNVWISSVSKHYLSASARYQEAQLTYLNSYSNLSSALYQVTSARNSSDMEFYTPRYELLRETYDQQLPPLGDLFSGPYFTTYSRLLEKFWIACDACLVAAADGNAKRANEAYEQAELLKKLIDEISEFVDKEVSLVLTDLAQSANQKTAYTLNSMLLVLLVIALALLLLGNALLKRILVPIKRLTQLAEDYSIYQDNLPPMPPIRNDETGILTASFWHMMEQIHSQIEHLRQQQETELQLQKEREKNARIEEHITAEKLKVFQSQINSHFLFNSLSMVSRLAYVENAPQAERAAGLIARFLQRVLNQFNRNVSIWDELSCVDNYIEIQKLRFGERIRYQKQCDPHCSDLIVPAMILQPLVENALIHGLSTYGDGGEIQYYALVRDDEVHIGVMDNGVGMEAAQIDALLSHLEEPIETRTEGQGIGLINVYRRLQLIYPGRVSPCIECNGGFTKIEFIIR